ncbi:MAG: DUF86 domain-containing protein [Chloroflexota bacterium]|nr:DUF86 domain-containing protein [Chloroflexota bacterium]
MDKRQREYAEKATRFVAGLNYTDFAENNEKMFAVMYALQVISEAANRLPRSLTKRYPEVLSVKVIGMRNYLIHGYDSMDLSIVWNTFTPICHPCANRLPASWLIWTAQPHNH